MERSTPKSLDNQEEKGMGRNDHNTHEIPYIVQDDDNRQINIWDQFGRNKWREDVQYSEAGDEVNKESTEPKITKYRNTINNENRENGYKPNNQQHRKDTNKPIEVISSDDESRLGFDAHRNNYVAITRIDQKARRMHNSQSTNNQTWPTSGNGTNNKQ